MLINYLSDKWDPYGHRHIEPPARALKWHFTDTLINTIYSKPTLKAIVHLWMILRRATDSWLTAATVPLWRWLGTLRPIHSCLTRKYAAFFFVFVGDKMIDRLWPSQEAHSAISLPLFLSSFPLTHIPTSVFSCTLTIPNLQHHLAIQGLLEQRLCMWCKLRCRGLFTQANKAWQIKHSHEGNDVSMTWVEAVAAQSIMMRLWERRADG